MTVLVTGSNGFIGRHFVDLIRNEDVVTFDVAKSRREDVRCFSNLPSEPVNVIVHLASLCVDPESVSYPLEYFESNVLGTVNLLEYARKHDVAKFLFASSASATRHVTPYGLSKHNGEEWCSIYHELYGLETCVLRIFNVYGYGQSKGVIYDFTEQLKHGSKLSILGDGSQIRDYIHVYNVAETMKQIMRDGLDKRYQIGTGVETSVNDLVKVFEDTLNLKITVHHLPRRHGDVGSSFAMNPYVTDFIPLKKGVRMMLEKEELLHS